MGGVLIIFRENGTNMKKGYDSLSLATRDLREEGYTTDFDVKEQELTTKNGDQSWGTSDFDVETFYRFEGKANPSDNSILYVINAGGTKGTLIMPYGPADNTYMSPEMVKKLDTNDRGEGK